MSNGEPMTATTAGAHGNRWRTLVALIVASIMAVSLALIAWQMSMPKLPVGPVGSLQAVMLTSGQIYYGTLSHADSTAIGLSGVFYVQSVVDARTSQPINKLVNRGSEDWHAPSLMLIPTDKIMFVEAVGPQSKVAQLIAEAKKKQ
jgi:hypothetical protein